MMSDKKSFPSQKEGRIYLTEGGSETEVMYKYGFDLPEFATFPLLDSPESPRVCRRLHILRGWSNEDTKKIFPDRAGASSPAGL